MHGFLGAIVHDSFLQEVVTLIIALIVTTSLWPFKIVDHIFTLKGNRRVRVTVRQKGIFTKTTVNDIEPVVVEGTSVLTLEDGRSFLISTRMDVTNDSIHSEVVLEILGS